VGKVTGKPVVVHFHDTTSYYPLSQKLSDRLLGGFTDAYIAVSKSVRDCWAHRCGIDPKRIKVMYNCTSIAEFQSPDAGRVAAQKIALGIPAGDRVIGTVTRLFEEKGTRYLLYAAAIVLGSIPAATFVVVGDGPMRAELQELSCRLGIQAKVKFTGYTEDVASILSTFDIMVLTSHAAEGGSPLPVIESMAMGRTVIVTDVVEIIENGRTGIVIPPRDPALLADAITFLLGNPSEAHRLGCNARKAAQVYDAARYVQNLGRIYSSLLARNEGK
jgi:glycosyltransferase involved in cell wall biosynthesis